MQVPEFWRAPNHKLYRIKRERRSLEDAPGALYTIRAYRPGDESTPLAEASVALREADLREMIRLNQQVPTPEQLYGEAFQAVVNQLG
jgi:hypothetical protein